MTNNGSGDIRQPPGERMITVPATYFQDEERARTAVQKEIRDYLQKISVLEERVAILEALCAQLSARMAELQGLVVLGT